MRSTNRSKGEPEESVSYFYTTRAVGRMLGISATQVTGLLAGCGITPMQAGTAKVIDHADFLKAKKAHERSKQVVSA